MYTEREKKLQRLALFYAIVILLAWIGSCGAEEVNVERLANAIYKAENSKTHPYGILAHYKTTTPRQACINTIRHALRDFKGGDFISFLGSRYAPINCNTDNGSNRYWVRNVRHWYKRLGNG
jgi:hypothetical protein